MNHNISIIGAGFSGLSAACYLAKWGYNVTVYEKHDTVGGRARMYTENGFSFDMGPSWYWMPDVFERFFNDFGKKVSDYYELKRLSPGYRVYYQNSHIDVPSSLEELYHLFEKIEPGSSSKLKTFLDEAKYKYEVGIHNLVYKPGIKINELIDSKLIGGLFKLDVFKSMSQHIRSSFKNEQLIQLLEFPVLFLGALPQHTPALYSLMNYADLALGTWYPMGGMKKIIDGMHQLALELGVKFVNNANVTAINVTDKIAKSIKLAENKNGFSALISSADYHFTEQTLLPKDSRKYDDKYWESRKMAPSCLIYYVGVRGKIDQLLHHNLFFDEDFSQHAKDIYSSPKWPDKPLFYVCNPNKTDKHVAPENHENLFILIPVAPGLKDTEDIRNNYFDLVIKRIEAKTGSNIKENIVYKRSYAPSNFVEDYNSFKGNAYGLANTLMQTAHLKPSILNKKVKNLFYTGQLTVPGPGVPPSLISGKLAAEQVVNYLNKNNLIYESIV
jgi:phytoene desaturase